MIIVNLDVELAKKKMRSGELAERIGITPANLSVLMTGNQSYSFFNISYLLVSFVLYAVSMILTKANAIAEENEYTI